MKILSDKLVAILCLGACGYLDAGCAAPQAPPSSPSSPGSHTQPDLTIEVAVPEPVVSEATMQIDPESLKLHPGALDIAADPSLRPIRIWIVLEGSEVTGMYVVGHADGECCPIISKLFSDVAASSSFEQSWFSFGIGVFLAGSDRASRARLARIRSELDEKAKLSECAKQVYIRVLDGDSVAAAEDRIENIARTAYAKAAAHDRPLLLWDDFHQSYPALVPVYVPTHDGNKGLEPLSIRMSIDDFQLPRQLSQSLSLDGIGQYIASLEAELESMDLTSKHASTVRLWLARGIPETIEGVESTYRLSYRDVRVKQKLEQDRTAAQTLRKELEVLNSMIPLLNGDTASWAIKEEDLRETTKKLDEAIDSTNRALEQWQKLPLQPDRQVVIKWIIVRSERGRVPPELREKLSKIASGWTAERKNLRRMLRKARAMRAHPPADPLLALVDAALRGWPATFGSADAEQAFDQWMQRHQKRIWEQIRSQLHGRKIFLGTQEDPVGALASSHLVFRVTRQGKALSIQPLYVLGGPFLLVADPGAGVVRFESAAADQNLRAP